MEDETNNSLKSILTNKNNKEIKETKKTTNIQKSDPKEDINKYMGNF